MVVTREPNPRVDGIAAEYLAHIVPNITYSLQQHSENDTATTDPRKGSQAQEGSKSELMILPFSHEDCSLKHLGTSFFIMIRT